MNGEVSYGRKAGERVDVTAAIAIGVRTPCICAKQRTECVVVNAMHDRHGLRVCRMSCRDCWRDWIRVG